jgi:hypothetical protein
METMGRRGTLLREPGVGMKLDTRQREREDERGAPEFPGG